MINVRALLYFAVLGVSIFGVLVWASRRVASYCG
jgi:hypothetical protein